MSVTIDSLDIQIRTSAGSAAANIDRLATALGNLQKNASLTKVSNNLSKLATSLSQLQASSRGLSEIRTLAGALKSLSAVQKSAGLNSVLNSLKKLPEITSQLNPAVIDAFSASMRKLADGLAPLAKQIEKIGAGFKSLPAKVNQCVTATNRMASASRSAAAAQEEHNDALDTQGINLAAAIHNIQAYMGVLVQIKDVLSGFISEAIEWDGIQFRFGRAFGDDAQDVYDWVLKINDALGINVQEFMQYSSLYGSLLKGFGVAQDKVTAIAVGATELSYDIWAAYNDRYKTLEDASEAIRSALTGEIEPIRNAGIALTEASMQEYLDNYTDLNVSIEKLTEAQKAEVRYAVMVNSAMDQGIVGTYAREMNTAEGVVRNLSQQMKTLGQSIGSLFLPILQKVIPWISAFVDLLTDAVHWIAALFGIQIQKIDWGSSGISAGASGLDDMADSADAATGALGDTAAAAKKLKDYTMGFDELNVIDPNSGSSGGGGTTGKGGAAEFGEGGGLDLESLWDQALLDEASRKVDEIKQKILDFYDKWKTQIAIIAGALAALGIASLLAQLGRAIGLGDTFLKSMQTIKKLATTAIVITLQYSIMTELLKGYIDGEGFKKYILALFVGALGTFLLYSMWGPAGIVLGLSVIAAASLSAVIDNGGITNVESAVVALTGLAAAVGAVYLAWKKVAPLIAASNLGQFAKALVATARGSSAASSALTFLAPNLMKVVGWFSKLGPAISGAATTVGTFLAGISAPVWAGIVAAIAGVIGVIVFLKKNWEEVTAAAKNFFEVNIVPKLESIKESWEKIKKALSDAKDAFLNAIPPEFKEALEKAGEWIGNIVDKVKEWFDSIEWLKMIGKAFEVLGGIIVGILGGAVAGVISTFVSTIENVVQIVSGLIQTISGVVEFIIAIFTGGDVEGAAQKMIDGIADIFGGLWGLVVDPIKEFWQGVIDWFTSLWDELVGHSIVPDMIDDIVKWFLSLPGKILSPIQDFVNKVIQKFKDMWSSIKSWWNSNVAPKFTKKYWQDVFDKVRQGAVDKLEATKKAISDKWNSIKSWFNSNVAPKFTLAYWKGKFENICKAISDKLGEVKTAASNKWGEIKSWYSSNVAPKFTLSFWLDKFKNLKEGFTQTIKNAVNAGIDLMNKFIGWLNEKLNFSWDGLTIAGKEVFPGGNIQLFTIPKIPRLEQGGFLEDGLFTMNRGEIAGKFDNGKSVVANNQMIVDGIAEGVYRAVVQAMNDSQRGNNGQNVNVYLDGKQIYASVKKTESERGMTLMGNQLGYAY